MLGGGDQIRRDEGVSDQRFPNGDQQVCTQPRFHDITHRPR